ncbi:MAG: M28 family metallopeptidase [Bacteroidia bacterium]|nr:M28 family metallopeptidase [Bacteroidia bacterium]
MELKSRRHTLFFYGVAFLIFSVCALASALAIVAGMVLLPHRFWLGVGCFPLAVAVLVFAVYVVDGYFRLAPKVSTNTKEISIGSKTYLWAHLAHVGTATRPPGFIGKLILPRSRAMELRFRDGQSYFIVEAFLANSSYLQSFIQKVGIEKWPGSTDLRSEALLNETLIRDLTFEFRGTFFFTEIFPTLSISTIPLLCFWGLMDDFPSSVFIYHFSILSAATLFLLFRSGYYFTLDHQHLTVHREVFSWKQRRFAWPEIEHAIIEQRRRESPRLILSLKDGRQKYYIAASLREEQWQQLHRHLIARKIPVADRRSLILKPSFHEIILPDSPSMQSPLLDRIKVLESLGDSDRMVQIGKWLQELDFQPQIQGFEEGINMFLRADKRPAMAIGSHFDTVPQTPGANDNASAIVVCLELAKRYRERPFAHIGLDIFFFDQEERGLRGSKAYVEEYGCEDLIGLINLEMVGQGDMFAIWPVDSSSENVVLHAVETVCSALDCGSIRVDQVVMNTADHESFRRGGLASAFTLTCIGPEDLRLAQELDKQRANGGTNTLQMAELIGRAPLFQHYHRATDTHEHLSESALELTVDVVWNALNRLDVKWEG